MAQLLDKARRLLPAEVFQKLPLQEVFPSSQVLCYCYAEQRFHLRVMIWGLPMREGRLLINARSETAAEKPSFRNLQPCVVPACGYFEWSKEPHVKYYFSTEKPPVYLAALYGRFQDQLRLVILTEAASEPEIRIHDRQPILLDQAGASAFCRSGQIAAARQQSLQQRTMTRLE